MTFITAVKKAGKNGKIRRKYWADGYSPFEEPYIIILKERIEIYTKDILATDWEVLSEPVVDEEEEKE